MSVPHGRSGDGECCTPNLGAELQGAVTRETPIRREVGGQGSSTRRADSCCGSGDQITARRHRSQASGPQTSSLEAAGGQLSLLSQQYQPTENCSDRQSAFTGLEHLDRLMTFNYQLTS